MSASSPLAVEDQLALDRVGVAQLALFHDHRHYLESDAKRPTKATIPIYDVEPAVGVPTHANRQLDANLLNAFGQPGELLLVEMAADAVVVRDGRHGQVLNLFL
jgi:hypothetical protein